MGWIIARGTIHGRLTVDRQVTEFVHASQLLINDGCLL